MSDKALTKKEEKILTQVLDHLEAQFDKELDAFAEVYDYDEDFIDIQVTLDNEYEVVKLDREELLSGKKPQEIALSIA